MQEQGRKLPYRVLGEYKPFLGEYKLTTYDASKMYADLMALVARCGFVVKITPQLRGPDWYRGWHTTTDSEDTQWHQDGGSTVSEAAPGIVLWSTKSPTQIRRIGEEEIFQPEPYQVVLADNRQVQHRRYGDMEDRWFARLFVELKPGDLE
jgi:hypothetical protein